MTLVFYTPFLLYNNKKETDEICKKSDVTYFKTLSQFLLIAIMISDKKMKVLREHK